MKKLTLALITTLFLNCISMHSVHAFDDEDYLLDPVGVMMWVEMPREVAVDEELKVLVTLKNTNKKALKIDDMDIGKNFITNFKLISITPKPSEIDKSGDTYTFEYPVTVKPGKEIEFILSLKAKKPGAFIGDIDVWIGEEFLTRYAQCEVSL